MKIAAAYIRVSTDDQTELSPDSQIKQIREYAKRNDIIVPSEFVFSDEGISGKDTKKRVGFNKMIGVAKSKPKPFECILLWKFSRFARNREDSILYKSMLRKQLGIDVISISENIGDDKMSILIEALIEAMDEYYSINLAEEVKRGMTEKASRGGVVAGPVLGYNVENKKYIINEETAPIVQMIFNEFLSGLGCREIATKLNAQGMKTRRGNLFENRTVEYTLRNPVYIGKIRWNPTGRTYYDFKSPDLMIVEGTHEPIIEKQAWEQAQIKLDKTKRMYAKSSSVNPPNVFMLQGLVKCSNCGSTLCKSTSQGIQCHSYTKSKCNVSHYISMPKIEGLVISIIEHSLSTGDFELNRKKPTQQASKIDVLIKKEYYKLQRVKTAYEEGIDSIEEYKSNKSKIIEAIKHLEAKQQLEPNDEVKFKNKFMDKSKNIVSLLRDDKISQEEKNKLLRSFIEKIVFDRSLCTVKIFYYA